jgi:prepilin-type N-terminal cleavage/methylation domain-containing protein
MLNKVKKSNNEGFTIIEVMIVLAIAGLILLIVFLAVPALQRSSRNTQRKNDVSAVSAAVANFNTDNGGAPISGLAVSGADVVICSAGGNATGTGNCGAGNSEDGKLGYYSAGKIYLNKTGASTVATTAVGSETSTKVSVDSVIIDVGYECNSTNTAVNPAPSTRSVAVLYATESGVSGGNGSLACVE